MGRPCIINDPGITGRICLLGREPPPSPVVRTPTPPPAAQARPRNASCLRQTFYWSLSGHDAPMDEGIAIPPPRPRPILLTSPYTMRLICLVFPHLLITPAIAVHYHRIITTMVVMLPAQPRAGLSRRGCGMGGAGVGGMRRDRWRHRRWYMQTDPAGPVHSDGLDGCGRLGLSGSRLLHADGSCGPCSFGRT